MPGRFYHPIELLADSNSHRDKKVREFFEKTRIITLSEFAARVRKDSHGRVYCNFNTLNNPRYELIKGYGEAFIRSMDILLQQKLGYGCEITNIS